MMRVYGKLYDEEGNYTWQVITTDANGYNDNVNLTALCQVLLLNLGESPFYANWGIGAVQSIMTQVAPDYDVMKIQNGYSSLFAALIITKILTPDPEYNVQVVTNQGAILEASIPI